MSRRDAERLQDILDALSAIESHLTRGKPSDGLIFDAVRVRLIEIGEAIKAISPGPLETEPTQPWSDIARMRDRLAYRYFDTTHGQVGPHCRPRPRTPARAAVQRIQQRLT